jgi:LPS export ABC transporter protein LptC
VDRLARRILAVVILFVLVVAGVLVARSQAVRREPLGPQPSNADLAIKEVELQEQYASGTSWQLTADQGAVFDRERRTTLRNIRVRVHDRERTWTIVGEEGDFFQDTRDVELRRNVVVTSDDGLRLETTVLRWKGADRRLWTDAPVRLYQEGAVVEGSGLDVHLADETATVRGRVRATFAREPGR